jgi:hypothetical protein
MIETIQSVFNIGETQILKEIDIAQKELCAETNILTTEAALSDIYTNITWSLPSDCKQVREVTFYDSDGMQLDIYDLELAYQIIFGKITFIHTDGTTILTGLPSSITYAYLDYVKHPASLTAVTDSLTIPENLHEALQAKVFKKLFSIYPVELITQNGVIKSRDWSAVRYWDNEYEKKKREAKRQANIENDATDYSKIKRNVLGEPEGVPRQRISTTGTIYISALTSIYSKYVRFTATSPSTISIDEQFGWTTSIATPTITSNVITVLSSAEFTNTMYGNPNQSINHRKVSASSWTFDVYDDYGTIVIEILEYK